MTTRFLDSRMVTPRPGRLRRGFSAMRVEQQKAIASLGGKAAHAKGRAHQWTVEEARAAGAIGGKVRRGIGSKASRGGRGKLPPAA